MKNIKRLVVAFGLLAFLLIPAVSFNPVNAQKSQLQCGANLTVDPNCDVNKNPDGSLKTADQKAAEDPTTKLNGIVALIINIISLIVGVIAVIMIIIAGLKYVTSGGDSGNITSAKNTIIYAIVGLVIVALAQFIVRFVLSKV